MVRKRLLKEKLRAVSNTGPILHLHEIQSLNVLKLFRLIVSPEVEHEIRNIAKVAMQFNVVRLKPRYKDLSKIITNEYFLDMGEAESIALAAQEHTKLFFTDDLEAREVGKSYGLEVHGTVGLILRAFREGAIPKDDAINKVWFLYRDSSLYITSDVVQWIIERIEEYKS